MRVSSNKLLQKYAQPTSHNAVTLLSAQNLSDSNFPEAARCRRFVGPQCRCRYAPSPATYRSGLDARAVVTLETQEETPAGDTPERDVGQPGSSRPSRHSTTVAVHRR